MKNQMDRMQYREGGFIKKLLKRGDTLFSIAEDNNLSISELLKMNPQIKNPDTIYAGDEINIGKQAAAVKEKQQGLLSRFRKNKEKETKEKIKQYKVQKGDTLDKIAKRNSLNLNQLMKFNPNIKDPNLIKLGQDVNVPQFGIREKEKFNENINAPRQSSRKRILPSNIRQLLYDINPLSRFKRDINVGLEDFTEADLDVKEVEALQTMIKRIKTEGSKGYKDSEGVRRNVGRKDVISYDDYQTSNTAYGDVGGGSRTGISKVVDKFNDPYYSMKTLVGQGTITTNDRGETVIVDRYNFNEDNPDSINDYALKAGLVAKDPFYQGPRQVASIYGSDEGEGSYVRLNLGKL